MSDARERNHVRVTVTLRGVIDKYGGPITILDDDLYAVIFRYLSAVNTHDLDVRLFSDRSLFAESYRSSSIILDPITELDV